MKGLLMKYYKDEKCPVCSKEFKEGDNIVVCPECGTPYHKECYKKVNDCINKESHGTYFYTNDKIEKIKSGFENSEKNVQEADTEEKIKCPYCDTMNHLENEECERCGMPFDNLASGVLFYKDKILKQDTIAGISIKDWVAYLGANAMSYIIKFKSIEKRKYSLLEFNFGAGFFGELYFLYRKMYLFGGLFFFLRMFITTFIISMFLPPDLVQVMSGVNLSDVINSAFFGVSGTNMSSIVINKFVMFLNQNPQVSNYVFFGWFVLSVLMGAVATRIYKSTSERKIRSIDKSVYCDDVSYRNVLVKKGSVNYLAVCLGLLFFYLFF